MKILHIGKFYSPIEGGIESINRFVVEALRENQQRILSFNNKNFSIEDDVNGIPVVRAASKGIVASQPISIKYFWEMRRQMNLFQPDVIHLHYPNPLAALYLLFLINKKIKLIVHWHSDIVAQKVLYRFVKPIENRLLKRADKVIATSSNYLDASENLIKFRDKTTVIPCSIDESKFEIKDNDNDRINTIKEQYKNKPIIFFIGRHVEYKGIEFLLKAEREVKSDCVFLIAGQGTLTKELKKKYDSTRIHWIGRLTDDEMKAYYYAASIFAFPSITRNEAFGVVLAESMYCECPAVTFTIVGSGVNWVSVNGETGLEVENGNFFQYAQAIDELINNPRLREELGRNAKLRVDNLFTKAKVSSLYQNLYNTI